jgi:hypothetical protein
MEMEPLSEEAYPAWACSITNFDKSLNLISNLMRETWAPQQESGYSSYLGLQNTELGGPSTSYHSFKTFSSDDVEWSVFFNPKTSQPQYAVSEGANPQTVLINNFRQRLSFDHSEFMPKECFE